MKKLLLGATAAAALTIGLATSADAANPVKCGGQQSFRPTPYTCYNVRTIDGVSIRVDVHVEQSGAATVLYSLPNGPIDRPIGLQIAAHVGFSSSPATRIRYDTMPAGADTFPLAVTFPATGAQANCGNQFDIKAWPGHQGEARAWAPDRRVSGATFTFPACTQTTTSTIASSVPLVPPSGPSTTAPGTTGVTAPPVVPSTQPEQVAGCVRDSAGVYRLPNGEVCTTPATGRDATGWLAAALLALVLGAGIVLFNRLFPKTA